MSSGNSGRSWGMLLTGLILGLMLGAMATSLFIDRGGDNRAPFAPRLSDLQLKASASHGSDTFAIATGSIDEDVEGLFTLDFLTGALQCFVINPKTGGVGGRFMINVNDPKIFGAKKGKKPNFLITTGQINAPGGYGGQRLGGSICYVVDANSGEVAAFGFPWNKSQVNTGGAQMSPMIPMGKWAARDLQQ
jgi:hypothetical protein